MMKNSKGRISVCTAPSWPAQIFSAQDRPDIRFSVREVCRDMVRPKEYVATRCKLVRDLKTRKRVVQNIRFHHEEDEQECAVVMVDSDSAGCTLERALTMVRSKAWSTTQGVVAVSNGEAEY